MSRTFVKPPLTENLVQDFCRLMYSDDTLHTEGIAVLNFIDDTFDEKSMAMGYNAEFYNEDLYREHYVKVSNLPAVTDQVRIPHSSS